MFFVDICVYSVLIFIMSDPLYLVHAYLYGASNGFTCLIRMAYRKQKRWWNAYILFYERVDEVDNEKKIYKTLQDLTIGKLCMVSFYYFKVI